MWVRKHVLSNEDIIQRKTKTLREMQAQPGAPDQQAEESLEAELHGLLEQEDLK